MTEEYASDHAAQVAEYGSVHGVVQCDRCLLAFTLLVTPDSSDVPPVCPECVTPLDDYLFVSPDRSGEYPRADFRIFERDDAAP